MVTSSCAMLHEALLKQREKEKKKRIKSGTAPYSEGAEMLRFRKKINFFRNVWSRQSKLYEIT